MVPADDPLPSADVVEIEHLYPRYCHAVDAGDGQAFAALFAADGVLDVAGTRHSGTAALAEFALSVPLALPGIRHTASNVVIGTSEGGAMGTADLIVQVVGPDGPTMITSGRYTDLIVQIDGAWRFATRTFTPDA